ncbi:histidine phosphatase family protein [Brevibacillus choshinensis]|uniref:Histidine phosphatase family protein n=1 Tax=Brevibacillus choshinensis TaxID=54911 RepID=A0ABX7FVK9_BRECH|nr:histidine phosphatase family protein [Brevibacillus choshinensis]QRG70258.1 histidine phosphatase family protein [Brevibacillus choshinensis]
MKIGLVRHFKVKQEFPKGVLSGRELREWFEAYDLAEIEKGETDLHNIEWDHCFASEMPRAMQTAQNIFKGPIRMMAELVEVPAPVFGENMKLPFMIWGILIRLSWIFNKKTRSDIEQAKGRIHRVLDEVIALEEGNVLIVSHSALMMFMRKELLKRGFRGPSFKHADNGKLYVFEN